MGTQGEREALNRFAAQFTHERGFARVSEKMVNQTVITVGIYLLFPRSHERPQWTPGQP
jgi:hypothetical protein